MKIPDHAPANLVPARNWHFQAIAERMRPDEQDHWLALSGAASYDADTAAVGFINTPGVRFAILGMDGMPCVVGGFLRLRGNVFESWMAGTLAGWDVQWRTITRAARWAVREQFRAGADRIQVTTLASRVLACDWYEKALGMYCEGIIVRAGAHGEDLVTFATLKEDWL